ncbi:L-threonylcarbamoyladenylate synthase [Paenibacillus endophyticus]|uniref:Threonylcarbamoyl-AMP synthase n=1 Tax=Paenibacillus endophyticus TaxID=1294268 RepID=A0A7W5CCX9_9BACL|nr:L-threonylcarbamoyladenylate synthase [Paenibacillus endophyticus]MBB3154549.1 L-threonylcarbamoyladenylate synthase [Paenibacillus endophyticus]
MITTNVWSVEQLPDEKLGPELAAAAAQLRDGGLIAFPTETVYGLGADARSSFAVGRIFSAKGRPSDNPLIVHIANRQQLDELVLPYPQLASALMDSFWPGPLTIVLPARPDVLSPLVTAGLASVGIRIPDHRTALALLELAGCPVAAPSANRSGRPSPTLARHVLEDLDGRIDGVVDDGATGVGLESTVVELVGDQMIRILRPGGITLEALRIAAPHATIDSASLEEPEVAPRSPGMKYTHYAPKGELVLVQGAPDAVTAYIHRQVERAASSGERTGVLAFEERLQGYKADRVLSLGSEAELETAAHRLYAALRAFDEGSVQRIWSESSSEQGIGAALMNRLAKAAGNRVVRV